MDWKKRVPCRVIELISEIHKAGFKAFLVGGAIRTIWFGGEPNDWDIATDAKPNELHKIFGKVIPYGEEYGIVRISFHDQEYEVSTFRKLPGWSPGSLSDTEKFGTDIIADLARRDFTINAIALDVQHNVILDPFNGLQDLERQIIRAHGSPDEKFRLDPVGAIRAIRLASHLGFHIEPGTYASIPEASVGLAAISGESLRDELLRILALPQPSQPLDGLAKNGLLVVVLPELIAEKKVLQVNTERQDVYRHSLQCCDILVGSPILRLAGLLHDIGKPVATPSLRDISCFENHEVVGAKLGKIIMKRFRFDNKSTEYVIHLIRNHMFWYSDNWTDSHVRRFVSHVGLSYADDLIKLRIADNKADPSKKDMTANLHNLIKRVNCLVERKYPLAVSDLVIDGNDVKELLGIEDGPQVGTALSWLLDKTLENPLLNERSKLLELLSRYMTKS